MARLTPLSKLLITVIVIGGVGIAIVKNKQTLIDLKEKTLGSAPPAAGGNASAGAGGTTPGKRPYKVAVSQWPGHMPIVVGAGGLSTQPGSAAAAEGLDLEIVFIEEPDKKNAALQNGSVDF